TSYSAIARSRGRTRVGIQCGGSEVRIVLAANRGCRLLNLNASAAFRFEVPPPPAATSVSNFKSKSDTRTLKLLVPLCFRSSRQRVLRCIPNFGNGALASLMAAWGNSDMRVLLAWLIVLGAFAGSATAFAIWGSRKVAAHVTIETSCMLLDAAEKEGWISRSARFDLMQKVATSSKTTPAVRDA